MHLPYWSVKEAQVWGPDLTECSLIGQVAVYGVPAVYCLCDVWGLLCLQTRHGKDGEAPSNAAFVWTGGEISVWKWNPDQTIPPVVDQVAGSPAMRVESDTVSISSFLAFSFVIKYTWVYSLSRFMWEGQKGAASALRGTLKWWLSHHSEQCVTILEWDGWIHI